MNGKRIILTGPPGIGKTTIVKKVSNLLLQRNILVSGFYTEELKKNGCRVGFDIVNVNTGEKGRLARTMVNGENLPETQYRVGKYVVLLNEFNLMQTDIFSKIQDPSEVVIIDEIGKMEMFCNNFKQNVNKMFDSNCDIVATIPIAKGNTIQFVENIRNDTRNQLFVVNNTNRDTLPSTIIDLIIAK